MLASYVSRLQVSMLVLLGSACSVLAVAKGAPHVPVASRCGTHRLAEVTGRPGPSSLALARDEGRSRAPSAPHAVGDTKVFWAWDLGVMPPGFRQVTATCRVVSDHSYVFVEDELVADGKVSDQDIGVLDTAIHSRTPSFSVSPRKGIFEIERKWLGTPPDTIDGDPRVFFLVLRMDEFNGSGFDGYFNAFDQLTEAEAWAQYQQHSNEAEVLYLNGARGDISGAYMRGVLAHELTHLIEYAYDQEELGWLSESVAEGAMQLTGYFTDNAHVRRYAAKPESPLVRESYANYGAGFLFSAYLQGALGEKALGTLLRDPGHGTASVEGALSLAGRPGAFESLHAAWAAANLWRGQGLRVPEYDHPGLIVPAMKIHGTLSSARGALEGELPPWGIAYLEIEGDGVLGMIGTSRVYLARPGKQPVEIGAEDELYGESDDAHLIVVGAGDNRSWKVTLSDGH